MSATRFAIVGFTVLSLFGFSGGSSFGQNPLPTIPTMSQPAATSNGASGNMQLDVVVTTSQGKPANPLTQQEFTLLDNKTPRTISSVAVMNGSETPVEVVIVVDSVNTPFIHLGYQREQISKYLRGNDGVLPYPTTFAVLTDTSFKVYGKASKNGVELAQALEDTDIGLREINRSQGFYGASDRLTISVKALSELLQAESKKPGRKLILWVSPGWPLLSGPEIDLDDKQREEAYRSVVAASDEMRNGNITLYSVNSWGATEDLIHESYYQSFLSGLKKPGDAQLGDLALQVMATQSGGLALNSSDVVGEIKQCVSDLDHYYRLTFELAPGDKPNQYHDLKVTVAANGLIARTRQGYYSQPYGNHAP